MEMSPSPQPVFRGTVLSEGGFSVCFANTGEKTHPSPNPINLFQHRIVCKYPRCKKRTRSIWGLCPDHYRKREVIRHRVDWIGLLVPTKQTVRTSFGKPNKDQPKLNAYASAHYETTGGSHSLLDV